MSPFPQPLCPLLIRPACLLITGFPSLLEQLTRECQLSCASRLLLCLSSLSPGKMFLVGLTGGIASGKSSVIQVFQQLGCAVIDVDVIARHGELDRSWTGTHCAEQHLVPCAYIIRLCLLRMFQLQLALEALRFILHPPQETSHPQLSSITGLREWLQMKETALGSPVSLPSSH